LCLDGYCPVSLGEKERWVRGDPRYGVIHRGRTYLFAGPEEANRFYADPDRYAPVMAGMDVVLAVEEHRQVPGRREHGAWFDRRVYLFSSEATFRRFDREPARYAAAAMQAATSMARRLPASPDPPAQSQAPPNLGYPPPARY
jgi:protein disulfide-isomerase